MRFEIYPESTVNHGSTQVYEDDGMTFDYLSGNDSVRVFTYFEYTFDNSKNQFTATVSTQGTYQGFPRYVLFIISNILLHFYVS